MSEGRALIAGRYSLDREIGRGGMGAVWLGRDEVLGRVVALKRVGMMPGGTSPDLGRAEREAKLAARLNHPHVVAVFDFVRDDDHQWLVMEYVDGITLSELIRTGGPLAADQAAPILLQVADALAAAHAAGIVHRDVKPSNILVAPDGQVKLSDFGIARAEADASLTQTGLVTGSPAYLAPEVASGRTATDTSDVWSLGATLYHALAGRPPYDAGDNLLATMYRIVHEDPPRLPDAGWLGPLLESTMTREPGARWSMARVRDFLAAGPVAVPSGTRRVASATPLATRPAADGTRVLSAVAPPRRLRRPGLLALALAGGIAALVLVTVVAYQLGLGGETPDGAGATNPSGGSSSPATGSGTGATAEGMERFIESYLATVTKDPGAAFALLTPEFQAQSGGLDGYESFWDSVNKATLLSIDADPAALTVRYSVEYNRGREGKSSDETTLQLSYDDGTYLIADEF